MSGKKRKEGQSDRIAGTKKAEVDLLVELLTNQVMSSRGVGSSITQPPQAQDH